MPEMQKILVTGAAGFIGYHVAEALCAQGKTVLGIDNMNDYYDVALKQARLDLLALQDRFTFEKLDFADTDAVQHLFETFKPDGVVHLGAQAGVRYSINHPDKYIKSNLVGFANILEGCRQCAVKHFVFASSSSVYGTNTKYPFCIEDNVNHPISLYAATKKSNELMAHSYAHLYQIPMTGLRFFTVYGPWGRPDMAIYKFTKAIHDGTPIDVFNNGEMERDFTYIDDITQGVIRILDCPAAPNPDWDGTAPDSGSSTAPYRLYNIGNDQPVNLMDMIHMLEDEIGKPVQMNMKPMQAGDVPKTAANIDPLAAAIGFRPATPLKKGLQNFVSWYREYHKITA